MALSYGFFDAELTPSGQYDRAYAAEQFAEYFHLIVSNGVFPDPATQLQVVASDTPNMNVNVSDGYGWINGYYAKNSGPYPLAIQAASGTLNRIDAVVLRWVNASRSMELAVKTGIAASSPATPALQRDTDVYELMLATVTVAAGATSIPQSSITDKRSDTSVCGWVTGAVQNIDTTNLFAQYDTAFQEWFDNIKSQLSGDVATNLQNQINKNAAGIATINATTLKADTKTALGLPTSAGPDDAFKVLANVGNLHVWEEVDRRYIVIRKQSQNFGFSNDTITYSSTAEVQDDVVVLTGTTSTVTANTSSARSILPGKYGKDSKGRIFYFVDSVDTNGTFEVSECRPGVSDTHVSFKTSIDSSVYPNDGAQGGYYYIYLGQLGGGSRIEVGSYVGTGTYGSSNPCSITFNFPVKILLLPESSVWAYSGNKSLILADDLTVSFSSYGWFYTDYGNKIFGKASYDKKTFSWYSTESASHQDNTSGYTYDIIAIG